MLPLSALSTVPALVLRRHKHTSALTVTSSLHCLGPARPSFQPVEPVLPAVPSCQMAAPRARTRQTRPTTHASLKIALCHHYPIPMCLFVISPPVVGPTALATFDMAPLPHNGVPYRPLLIRSWSDLLFFLLFFHQRPVGLLLSCAFA